MAAKPEPRSPGRSGSDATPPRRNRDERPWRVEGARGQSPRPDTTGGGRGGVWKVILVMLAAEFALWAILLSAASPARVTLPYTVFTQQVNAGNVTTVSAQGASIQGTLRHAVTYPATNGTTSVDFATQRPTFASDNLLAELQSHGIPVTAKPVSSGSSTVAGLLMWFLPVVLIFGFFWWIMRRSAGAGAGGPGMFGGFGSSRARRYTGTEERTTFADVAGIDEATEELAEVVDFLRHPDRYRRLGGRIPKGVLLTGPPGTGKTLLARAVAGEAEVPFFSISASEFVEMIVGVGASRVRDLFVHAKQEAPAIVFIDELDAIGRQRGAGALSGANDEREQTLNQILTEMDGFTGNEGVIVLAATNRPEILDPALLRAGRFDRRISVNPPDQDGRLKILRVHTRGVPLDDTVDLPGIASATPGMVGADLRNLVNEAALAAARRGAAAVSASDFTNAMERIVLGAARRIVISEDERRRTAYHESGHALLGMLQPGADPVRKVSIIPRGHALGVTFQSPESDRYGYGESYLRGRLVGLLGGRAAEQLIYGETTTGAESDLEQATALARQMVGRWGMSPHLGLVSALPRPGEETLLLPGTAGGPSQRTLEVIDDEVKRLTDRCYQQALSTLSEHREQLDRLAQTLLARETLDEADAYAAAGIPARDRTDGSPGLAPLPEPVEAAGLVVASSHLPSPTR
jgi:cell division protease FtsH